MKTVLLILSIVIFTLMVYSTDWRAVWRRWHMLRDKEKLDIMIWYGALLVGVTLLIAGLRL